jgi:hypothetical protein
MTQAATSSNFDTVDALNGYYVNGTQVIDGNGNAIFAAGSIGSSELNETLVQYATGTITNAQALALRATPKTLVAAPGAGKVLEFISLMLFFNYTAAYTESTANLAVKYTDGSGAQVSQTIEATGFADATVDTQTNGLPKIDAIVATSASDNKALVLHNLGAGEWGGGNAANEIYFKVAYRVHTTGL